MMRCETLTCNLPVTSHTTRFTSRGGGGVLGLEKGTDCGPSAAELWLLRANNAKKGELSSDYR